MSRFDAVQVFGDKLLEKRTTLDEFESFMDRAAPYYRLSDWGRLVVLRDSWKTGRPCDLDDVWYMADLLSKLAGAYPELIDEFARLRSQRDLTLIIKLVTGLAALIKEKDTDGEIEIRIDVEDSISEGSPGEDVIESERCLVICDQPLICWMRRGWNRIYDPVNFYEIFDDEEEDDFERRLFFNLDETLSALKLGEPAMKASDEVEHPKSVQNGKFGVVYHDLQADTEEVIEYKDAYDAQEAYDLSEEIMVRDGIEDQYNVVTVRRRDDDERLEAEEEGLDDPWDEWIEE